MSSKLPMTDINAFRGPNPPTPQSAMKPQRILACVLCQQRKVKCDRKFPCANCVKQNVQCVPATQTRRRKRRFPERELLDQLRTYEDLLRQNNINFEPLHQKVSLNTSRKNEDIHSPDDEHHGSDSAIDSPSSVALASEGASRIENIWQAMGQGVQESDDDSDSQTDSTRDIVFKKAWDRFYENDDHLLFGSNRSLVDLSALHPDPVQMFRLWQIYLDNVNPLLKVTHTPTLQQRFIEAAANTKNIDPPLEALMFSIYCMAFHSLDNNDCQVLFGSTKDELLRRYQSSCQQALLNASFLRSNDRDCLTALYLYLISAEPQTHPRALSSILGIAVRIAQHMGLQYESNSHKYTILEAEMRRRLWWSIVLFESRISEMADCRDTTLNPTWDCKLPLNVNDSDLREEMKEPPSVQARITDSLFAVVRTEIAEFNRHNQFFLNLTNPALKPVAKKPIKDGDLDAVERSVEEKYLRFCDDGNALHFMTIWATKAHLARSRLFANYSKLSTWGPDQQNGYQEDDAMSCALEMLRCDTKLLTAPLIKGYKWLLQLYFPFVAYVHIVKNLSKQSVINHADEIWEAMSDNYDARFQFTPYANNSIFRMFSRIILQGWDGYEKALERSNKSVKIPRIILNIRDILSKMDENDREAETKQTADFMDINIEDFLMSMPIGFGQQSFTTGLGGQVSTEGTGLKGYPNAANTNHPTWDPFSWNMGQTH